MGAVVHATSRIKRVTTAGGPTWWQGDMADLPTAQDLISVVKPDIVFHLAGVVGASASPELILPTFHSLLTSTVNLLTVLAKESCHRVVLASSMTEPDPVQGELTPGSPYAAAKWASGVYGRMFHRLYGSPCMMLRLFMTYGPTQDPMKLIPSVTLALLRGEAPRLSSGKYRADWIYIDDVVEGLLKAALTPGIEGTTMDLGSGVLVPVREIVQGIKSVIDTDIAPLFGALPDRPFEHVRIANTADMFAKLGWKATTSLKAGLQQTVAWYRAQSDAALCSSPESISRRIQETREG